MPVNSNGAFELLLDHLQALGSKLQKSFQTSYQSVSKTRERLTRINRIFGRPTTQIEAEGARNDPKWLSEGMGTNRKTPGARKQK